MSARRIVLLLSLLPAAALLSAQSPPELAPTATPFPAPLDSSQPVPTIRVTSRLVVLDVIVTDGHGRAITGLKPTDLTLTEDGVPQKLSAFTEHDSIAEAPPAAATPEPLPPNTFAVQPPIPGDLPKTVIVLGADTPAVRDDLQKFVKTVPAGAPIAIFRGDWKGIHLVQDFTTDPNVLQEAADSQRILPPFGIPPPSQIHLPDTRGLASYLSAIPGRINLVWISGNAPIGEISESFPDVSNLLHDLNGTTNVVHLSRIAVYPINAEGVIVPGADRADFDLDPLFRNPITAPLITTPLESESLALQGTGFFSGHDLSLTQNPNIHFDCLHLQDLAASTGGRSFCNTNGFAQAISEVVETGSHYYTISYTPTNPRWNGAIRRIKVEVPLAILQAHTSASEKFQDALESMVEEPPRIEYRNFYRARSTPDTVPGAPAFAPNRPVPLPPQITPVAAHPAAPIHLIQAAMGLGEPAPDAIHFNLTATPASEIEHPQPGAPLPKENFLAAAWRDQPYRNLLLHFSVDPADLRFTTDGSVHNDALEFIAVVYRDDGVLVNSFSGKATLSVDDQGYARILSAPLTLDRTIAVPLETNYAHYYLRTAVHEVPTDRIGAIELPAEWIKHPSPQTLAAAPQPIP